MDGAGFILERALTVSHFRVSFLKKTLPVRLLVAVDALLQPTGGLFQLTPSVFLRARALKTGVKAPQGAFFACPACAAPLDDTPPLIHCPACEKQYPVIDDIYDFRLNPPAEDD